MKIGLGTNGGKWAASFLIGSIVQSSLERGMAGAIVSILTFPIMFLAAIAMFAILGGFRKNSDSGIPLHD